MIHHVLNIIRQEAANYVKNGESLIVLDNVANATENTPDAIFLTLLSMEEEATMKNIPNTKVVNGRSVKIGTPAYLNLYVMFAIHKKKNYNESLEHLSAIVELFQNKPLFTHTNTPDHETTLSEFKFTMDLCSTRFEQLSYVWGVLGGKVMPSALYKVSVIKVEKEVVKQKSPAITQLKETSNQLS